MTGRAALGVVGVLAMLAAIPLQLYRTTLDPMPVWAAPLLLALTLGKMHPCSLQFESSQSSHQPSLLL